MARTVNIAAQVKLQTNRVQWTVAHAEFVGWADQYYSSPVAVIRVIGPKRYAGLEQTVLPEYFPPHIRAFVPQNGAARFSSRIRRLRKPIPLDDVLIAAWPGNTIAEPAIEDVDGWIIRDDFLRLPRSTDALVSFLSRYGSWSRFTDPHRLRGTSAPVVLDPEVVPVDEIWTIYDPRRAPEISGSLRKSNIDLQELLRWGLTCGSAAWFESLPSQHSKPLSGPDSQFPHFTISALGCLDVLFATVTLDYMTGTQFRICARTDCGIPFALESRHQRSYCCQYCAHIESVRRNRDKAAKRRRSPKVSSIERKS